MSSFRAPLTHSQTKLSGRLDIGTGPALQTRHVQPITSSSDERTDVYGVCVIGNGMMGSAAARHLSLAGCKVYVLRHMFSQLSLVGTTVCCL